MNEEQRWKTVLVAYKSFLRFIENLNLEELQSLESNSAKITFSLQSTSPSVKPREDWNPADLIATLTAFLTREEAENWLASQALNKRQLQEALKSIDIPWDKLDKAEKLRDKLIEATIGFRLRSRAIQGS